MRNDAGNIIDRQPSLIERFLRSAQHGDDGLLVNFLARHVNGLQMLIRVFARDRGFATAAGHEQNIGVLTIAADVGADDAVRSAAAMPQNRRARAIAKKHARVAIGPVRDRGQFFRANDENGFVSVRSDKLLRDLEGEEKASARGRNIEAGCLGRADFCLHKTSRGRKHHVGRGCRDENEIDLSRFDLGLLDRFQRSLRRHVARVFVLGGDAAFLDASARGDPLVARVDHSRQVGVGQNFFRHVTAGADDRNGAACFNGARARAGLSFHYNGESPRRYAGSPVVQSTPPRRATHS